MEYKIGYINVSLGNVSVDRLDTNNNWYYKEVEVTGIPNGAILISCVKIIYNANVMIGVNVNTITLQSPVSVTLPANRRVYAIWAKF